MLQLRASRSPLSSETGRKCRRPQAHSLDVLGHLCYTLCVGLGTLVRQGETVRLHGTFPTERSGSHRECRDGVKRSRSITTLRARHAGRERAACQTAQSRKTRMCRAMKPKLYSPLGYRVAAEYRHKPLTSSHGVSDVCCPVLHPFGLRIDDCPPAFL